MFVHIIHDRESKLGGYLRKPFPCFFDEQEFHGEDNWHNVSGSESMSPYDDSPSKVVDNWSVNNIAIESYAQLARSCLCLEKVMIYSLLLLYSYRVSVMVLQCSVSFLKLEFVPHLLNYRFIHLLLFFPIGLHQVLVLDYSPYPNLRVCGYSQQG